MLDFILSIISKSFSLNLRQSAALLADNHKYLNYLLIKGMQNIDYKPIKKFYQEFLNHIGHYINLIDINSIAQPYQISKNIEMSLNVLKPGLLSKSIDVVYLAGRVLSKIAFELTEKNLIASAWDWFVMPDGGLETSIMMLKKHDTAAEVVVSLIVNFSRYHLFELFTVYLRKLLDSEGAYIAFMCDLIEYLSRMKYFCDEFTGNKKDVISNLTNTNNNNTNNKNDKIMSMILENQVVSIKKTWVLLVKEESQALNINTRIQTCQFLGEMWSYFSFYFETEDECHDLLDIFKNLSRDPNILVKYSSITQLFRLLKEFSKERNFIAPVIYKSLIFIMIENQDISNIREYIINNFKQIFKMILSIPVGILVEPFSKQILYSKNTNYSFNLLDVNFLLTISKHPRLSVKDAIMVLDILGKIYNENVEMYKAIKGVFLLILSRYMMNELGVEFTFKYVKFLILNFCIIEKENSDKLYTHAVRKNLNPNDYEYPDKGRIELDDPVNFKINLTKDSILEMIYDILLVKNSFINNIIKNLLISTQLRHYKVYNFYNIGLSLVVDFYGDSQEIFHYYNKNLEELELDKEFILQVNKIFDRTPEIKEIPEEERILNQGLLPEDANSEKLGSVVDYNTNENNKDNKSLLIKGKLKRIDGLGKKALNDIKRAKEKFNVQEKNKELKDEIKRLKDEKYLPKNRQFSIGNEFRRIKNDLNNYFNNGNNNNIRINPEYQRLVRKEKDLQSINNNNNLNTGYSSENKYNIKTDPLKFNQPFHNLTVDRDLNEYLSNVDYHSLIRSEGYTKMNENLNNIPSNIHNKLQILNYDIPILNLDNEEDCDLVSLKKLIKDYSRFFRFMIHKYTGSVYQPIYGKEFTSINTINDTIAPSEIVKMFRDHDIIHKYITKDEILLFIGMMNLRIFKKATSKTGLNYNEFIEVFIQLAYYIYTKPPYNFPDYSISRYVLELIKNFSLIADYKGNLTVEYLHANELLTPIESEICDKLNDKISKYGVVNVKMPEGYKKYLDTEVKHKFFVPDCMVKVMGRSVATCTELLDEIISNALYNEVDVYSNTKTKKTFYSKENEEKKYKPGDKTTKSLTEWCLLDKCHILEPYTKIKEVYKAKPGFLKLPRDKEKSAQKQERLNSIFNNRNNKNSNRVGRSIPPKINNNQREKKPNNIEYLNDLNISRFRDNSITDIRNNNIISHKKKVKDSEVQRIFDEIDNNQSDDEFKKTIRKFLTNELVENKKNDNHTELDNISSIPVRDRINTEDLGVVVNNKRKFNNNNSLSLSINNTIDQNNANTRNNNNIINPISNNRNNLTNTNIQKSSNFNSDNPGDDRDEVSKSVYNNDNTNNNLINIENIEDPDNEITNNNYNENNDNNDDLTNINISNINHKAYNKTKSNNYFNNNNNNNKTGIINQVKLNKLVEEEIRKREEKEREMKRIKRMNYVKEELEKLKLQKQEKEQSRMKLLTEKQKKEEEKRKRKLEQEAELRLKIKEELDKVKRISNLEEKQKLINAKKQKISIIKEKAKQKDVFFTKQTEKLKQEFSEIYEKRNLSKMKVKINEEYDKVKKLEEKKKLEEFFKDEKKIRAKERMLHQLIEDMNCIRLKNNSDGDMGKTGFNKTSVSGVMNTNTNNNINANNFKNGNARIQDKVKYIENNNDYEFIKNNFSVYFNHIKLIYDIYAKTLINPENEITQEDFFKFCNNFNINNLLLNTEEIGYIFKKIAYNPKTPHIKTLNLREFNLALVYLCLFSLDNFVDVSKQNQLIADDPLKFKINYYDKINEHKQVLLYNKSNVEAFFDYLEFTLPFNKNEIENYVNIQKNMSHLEKNVMLKNKSEMLPVFNRTVRNSNYEYEGNNKNNSNINEDNNNNRGYSSYSKNRNDKNNISNNSRYNEMNENNDIVNTDKSNIENDYNKDKKDNNLVNSGNSLEKNNDNSNIGNKLFSGNNRISNKNISKNNDNDDKSKVLSDSSLIIK